MSSGKTSHAPRLLGSLCLISLVLWAARAEAQVESVLYGGARVRVTYACSGGPSGAQRGRSDRCREIGTFISSNRDSLRLWGQHDAAWAIPWVSVRKFELSEGRYVSHERAAGFALGFGVLGLAAGAAFGCAIVEKDPEMGCAVGVALGGLVGGLVGFSVGLMNGLVPVENWTSLTFPGHVSIGPGDRGSFGIFATLNF